MRINTEYPPPALVVQALGAATTRVTGRVEIYEEDGTTRWTGDTIPRLVDGSISIDYSRDERRSLDLTLDNTDDVLQTSPGYFWYDKVIKTFKRVYVRADTYDAWEYQVGEFMIDSITEDHFPYHSKVAGRDYTKRCLNSKFIVTTQFNGPNVLETLIKDIALNAGITKYILPTTGITVSRTFSYEKNTPRWQAMKEIANAYNYDVFFDPQGYLRMELFPDPATQSPIYILKTGLQGNLATYTKSIDDSRLYNHVLVVGGTAGDALPPWAEAKNTTPGSPTSIAEIGDRVYEYDSDFITTVQQAQAVANSFLAIHQLEQFSLNFSGLNIFYLDAGTVIQWEDPRPSPGDPDRFLLQTLTIPIGLGLMSGTAGRVIIA